MQIVILCGGLGTRLGEISKKIPKSMVRINNKPFLEYQIKQLKKNGVKDIVLCVGHLSEEIINYFGEGKKLGVKITYSNDGEKQLGPIGALKNAESKLEDIFFTLYGDSYIFVDYNNVYKSFLKKNTLAMMTVYQNRDKYDKSNLVVKKGMVKKYNNKKTKDMIYIDYGVSIFKKKTLQLIPENTFFSTNQLYSKLVENNELAAYEVNKRFYHIGTPKALQEFKNYIKTR